MFTREKIKMEDSYHQFQSNPPHFPNEDSSHTSKYAKNANTPKATQVSPTKPKQNIKYNSFKTDQSEDHNKPYAARNSILKELRQEYEILRNIAIDDSVHVSGKKGEKTYQRYQEKQPSLSSSMASKENKARENATHKQSNRQVEGLYLQKKQLQLVIGNSMRKIEELLNNEITLKKTIHQLKNQIEGRGGITMEYEKVIRGMQKNQEDLQAQFARLKHQNEKNLQKIKEQNEKVRVLEVQIQKKDREIRLAFDQQRKLQQIVRTEKDKYMNLQIQCRSYRMEFQMLEKQKNNEINRLLREFQGKEGGSEKQLTFIVKKLQNEVREKDKRYHELLLEREKRIFKESDVGHFQKKGDKYKNYLEEILFKSKEVNDHTNKAFADGMSLMFTKMAEMERKTDQNLRKELDLLKRKTEEMVNTQKTNDNERELSYRINQLQKIIAREGVEKEKLYQKIKELKDQKLQLQQSKKEGQRKLKEHYSRKQSSLVQKFSKEFEQITVNYHAVEQTYNSLKAEYVLLVQKLREHERIQSQQKAALQNQETLFREKEKQLDEQIRSLRRKIDEANFEAEKNKKEGEFNLTLSKTSQDSELKRLLNQNQRTSQQLREAQEKFNKLQRELESLVKLKERDFVEQRKIIQSLHSKLQEQMLNQKKAYEERMAQMQLKHAQEMKGFSQKYVGVTATNERLMAQLGQMGKFEGEALELRRLLKNNRSTNSGIDHLWQIKETEYSNISHILQTIKQECYQ